MDMASVSGETLVDLQDLHLTLDSGAGAVNILRGVDLQITRGETLGVVGPSGSGKSTMLAVTAGLERPSSGHVNVAGKDLGLLNEDQLALFRRKHVGIVFQSFHLIPTMTAHENVAVPLELAGDPDAFERARESLADVGLSDRLTHYPTQLSGGEQQMLAMGRALMASPKILLLDEPSLGLAPLMVKEIARIIREIRDSGLSVILVAQNASLALKLADKGCVLETGRVALEGDAKDLISNEYIKKAYLGG